MGVFLSRHFEVIGVKTGLEAMARLSSGFIPDVIIADSSSTELGGVQLAASLKYSGMFSHIPFILLGDHSAEHDAMDGMTHLGIRAVLSTPLDPVELRDRVYKITSRPTDLIWANASAA